MSRARPSELEATGASRRMLTSYESALSDVARILSQVAGLEASAVTPTDSLREDLEVDSLAMLQFVVAVERRFGVRIPDSEVEHLMTVADVLERIGRSTTTTAHISPRR